MKITFGQSVEKRNKPPLKVQGGYVKAPKLSDDEIKQINETRVLPDGYYLGAHKPRGRGDSGPAYLNIQKDKKGWDDGFSVYGSDNFYTPILPKGYEVENYKGKTYLKEEGVNIKKRDNLFLFGWLSASLAVVLTGIGVNLKNKF